MSEKKVSKKDDKKAVKKKDSGKKAKFSLIQKFRETIAELKKVTWPSRKDLVRHSIVVYDLALWTLIRLII